MQELESNGMYCCSSPNGQAALERIHPDIIHRLLEVGCERFTNLFTTLHANGTQSEKLSERASQSRTRYGQPGIGITSHKMQSTTTKPLLGFLNWQELHHTGAS